MSPAARDDAGREPDVLRCGDCFGSRMPVKDLPVRRMCRAVEQAASIRIYSFLITTLPGQPRKLIQLLRSRWQVASRRHAPGSFAMLDIAMLAAVVGFFGLALGYAYACERL